MMKQVHLLDSLPKVIRDPKLLEARRKVKEDGETFISCMYEKNYFDGPRKYGYGGYYDDGRWAPVAKKIIDHYNLNPGSRVADIGCAKGFLVKEFRELGMEAFGLDVSKYAVRNCSSNMVGYIHCGDILAIPFPNDSFDLVLAINVVHNIDRGLVCLALKELMRVSRKDIFITVDSYYTEEQRKIFENWVLTAKTHGYTEDWLAIFRECGYDKDYDWTIWKSGYE